MRTCLLSLALPACLSLAAVATGAEADFAAAYATAIHPLMVKTCGECHGAEPKDNDLNLAGFATSESLLARPAVIEHVIERLHIGDMPDLGHGPDQPNALQAVQQLL
jgi:mono/diheme cytochrome c family protein